MADEELRLRVSVDDQASAQLIKLKNAMQEISGGANAAAMERMARMSQELGRHLRPVAEEAHRTTGAVNLLSRGLTSLAGAIAGGFAIDKIKQFSDSMLELKSVSLQTGFSLGQIKAAVDGLEQSGISRGTTIANIKSLAAALYDLGQVGSPLAQQLLKHSRTDPQAMAALLQRLTGFANVGDLRGAVNAVFEAYSNVVANEYNRTHSEFQARMKGKSFLEELKLSPEVVLATQQSYKALSDAQIAALGRALKAAEDFNREWVKTRQFVDEVTAGIQVPLAKAMAEFNEQIRDSGEAWGDSIGKQIAKFATDVAKVSGDIKQIIDFLNAPTWDKFKSLGPLLGIGGGQAPVSIKPSGVSNWLQGIFGGAPATPGATTPLHFMGGQSGGAGGGRFDPMRGGREWQSLSGGFSTNIEDRRDENAEEQTDWLKQNTAELKRLNEFLAPTGGGAPGGALGFLGTQAGGLAEGLGGGTGTARLGGPMGAVPGMGGGPPSGTPGTGSGTPSGTPGTGTGGTPGTPGAGVQWPAPGAGNIMPPGFGQGAPGQGAGGPAWGGVAGFGGGAGFGAAGGIAGLAGGPSGPAAARGGGGAPHWASTVFPGAGGAWGGQPVATPPGWGPTGGAGAVRGRSTGGAGGGNDWLAQQRAGLMAEINRDPKLRARIADVLDHESHGDQVGAQGIMETMVNRAMRLGHKSLWQTINSGFYGPVNRRELRGATPNALKIGDEAISRVAGGSNITDFRDDQGTNKYGQPEIPKGGSGVVKIGNELMYYSGEEARQYAKKMQAGMGGAGGDGGGAQPAAGGGGERRIMTAREAGVSPRFPTGNANVLDLDAEFVTRLNRAYDAMSPEEKESWRTTSGHRTYEQQAELYRRYKSGQGGIAARPGHSEHESRTAIDVGRSPALSFLQRRGGEFGVGGILGGLRGRDPPHIRMLGGRRPFAAAGAATQEASTGAVPYLSQQQELDRLSGRELDKTPSVNVTGTGKISVEVKAPKGTQAGANGDGLFKKTEVVRQTQMEPAKSSTSSDATGGGQIESPA